MLGSATSLAGASVMKNENVRVGEGDTIAARSALMVSGRFFELLGVRFVIINESMARRLWPGEDPIGRLLFIRMRGPYLAVAGLLTLCAIAAGYWPARRIVRINPLETLRQL